MEYTCEICGRIDKHRGAHNLHVMHCEAKELRQRYKEETCDHEWRMLNPHDKAEQQAMNDNYMEVCDKCQTLR